MTAVEYTLDRSDLEAFVRHHAKNAPHRKAYDRRMVVFWILVIATVALLQARTSIGSAIGVVVFGVVVLVFRGPVNRWWIVRHNMRLSQGPDAQDLGDTRLELVGGRLHTEGPEGTTQYELSAIKRIEESATHHFLILGPSLAIVVPRTAPGVETFMAELREALTAD